jgi:hypothetical protein
MKTTARRPAAIVRRSVAAPGRHQRAVQVVALEREDGGGGVDRLDL